jgi:flagellar basal-body rod protein FlgC
MNVGRMLSATDISASGLAAERLRMEVIANNIANANTTRTDEGGPYRRKQVVFATAQDRVSNGSSVRGGSLGGVEVAGVELDQSELPRIYQPGHPDADASGFVLMPNVKPANEMVDLITASRAYEANLRVLRSFRDMVEQALTLLQRR